MDVLRTPDDRFSDLPDFAYTAHYTEVSAGDGSPDVRMAYIDEGPRDGRVVLLLHGEPSWSFLYRFVIRDLVAAGHRAIAPDLIGFGRSDKPTATDDYTYRRHVAWVSDLVGQLDLDDMVLVCQDWGGLIGLRMVAQQPERFAGVVAANTFLPDGKGTPSQAFLDWQTFSQTVETFPTGMILQGATTRELTDAELINPYAVGDVAEAFYRAATMPLEEQQRRMRTLKAQVSEQNIYTWASKILTALFKFEFQRL